MNLTTFSSRAVTALVAAVAGFASYQHIYRVATHAGEHQSVAGVLPLAIDGLILVATLAMLDDKRNRRQPRLSARVALVFGVLATLAANIASAHPNATARAVAAIPAVSFLLAVEVLARTGKPLPVDTPPAPAKAPATKTPAEQALTAVMDATAAATSTPRRPAKKTPTKATTARQSNADLVAKAVAKNPAWTQAEVATRLQLGERTVQRYWPKPAPATTHANGYDHSTAEVN